MRFQCVQLVICLYTMFRISHRVFKLCIRTSVLSHWAPIDRRKCPVTPLVFAASESVGARTRAGRTTRLFRRAIYFEGYTVAYGRVTETLNSSRRHSVPGHYAPSIFQTNNSLCTYCHVTVQLVTTLPPYLRTCPAHCVVSNCNGLT